MHILIPAGPDNICRESRWQAPPLARYNAANGTLDATFDDDGKVTTNLGATDYAYAMALQKDGKIVLAGTSNGNFALARYTPSGSLDTSFDGDGKAITDTGGTETAWALAIQLDGKIVAAGERTVNSFVGDFVLVRYHDAVRLYVQQDANFNVTAVTDSAGTVLERYIYEPYGSFTVLNPDWLADEDGQSDYGQVHLHQGGRYDAVSGTYHFRNRDFSPSLGRWVQQDPMGYVDGMSLYEYVASSPVQSVDPSGLSLLSSIREKISELKRAVHNERGIRLIGFVYELEYEGTPGRTTVYVGSANDLEDRLSKKGHSQSRIINDPKTKITAWEIWADPDPKASNRPTWASAVNEAKRSQEAKIMARTGLDVGGKKPVNGRSLSNKYNAATVQNMTTWEVRHHASLGQSHVIKEKCAKLRGVGGGAISSLMALERFTLGTWANAKENGRSFTEQLKLDVLEEWEKFWDMENDDIWWIPITPIPNPMPKPKRGYVEV